MKIVLLPFDKNYPPIICYSQIAYDIACAASIKTMTIYPVGDDVINITAFPTGLATLHIMCDVSSLPKFPSTLKELHINRLKSVDYLPDLPRGLLVLTLKSDSKPPIPLLPLGMKKLISDNNARTKYVLSGFALPRTLVKNL